MPSFALVPYIDPEDNRPFPLTNRLSPDELRAVQIGPGRILYNLYTSIGRYLESNANRMAYLSGLGPIAVTERIEKQFGGSLVMRQERLEYLVLYLERDRRRSMRARGCLRYLADQEGVSETCAQVRSPVSMTLYQFCLHPYILDRPPDLKQSRHRLTPSSLWSSCQPVIRVSGKLLLNVCTPGKSIAHVPSRTHVLSRRYGGGRWKSIR